MRHIVKQYQKHFKGRCLDIGATPHTIEQMPQGNRIGLNIDASGHEDIEWCDLNLNKLPFNDNDFDFILFSHTLEHLENPYRMINECKRVLKPGGRMILAVPRLVRWNLANFEKYELGHKYFFTGKTIKHMLKMQDFKPLIAWVNYPLGLNAMYFLWNYTPLRLLAKDIHILCEVQK